ncbi:hypothetical protein I79_001746 [Cricetulus griseus]|uniref:Uncharacterized protein n=1 Tax=Cricetulus griseus TaxID=10029 RepID=G3GVK7_CRIGR|nr:hypothetical protein I79_001746 [Cricetulus griseus]
MVLMCVDGHVGPPFGEPINILVLCLLKVGAVQTPLIQELRRQRQVDLRVQGQPDLHSKFQDSQSFGDRPCLKKKKVGNREKTNLEPFF